MRILWITLESILPANTGGRIGVFKRLVQLSRTNEIYLFYPYDNESELTQINELNKYCKKVYPYSRAANKKHGLVRLLKYPFTVGSREFASMKLDIQECIKNNNIDIVNIDFPHMCVNLIGLNLEIPVVLNEHNIEWKVYKTIANSHTNFIMKALYYIDSFRLKKYEESVFKNTSFSKITFVSSKDMQAMIDAKMVDKTRACLIPVGADIQEIHTVSHVEKNIIFVGKMSYGPNIEAAKWFAKEIFPKIKEHINNAKFYIVGKDPTEEVEKLRTKDVIITGMVPDIKKYYEIADLVVLPLKNGGGVKVKLLEAISFNKPIVSTSVGVEGTYFASNYIPVSDEPQLFAELCESVLNDKNVYPKKEVYDYFINNYTWAGIGKKYEQCLEEAIVGGKVTNERI